MKDKKVYIQNLTSAHYPVESPFNPSKKYPEYQHDEISSDHNFVYEGIRELFHLMELDLDKLNTEKWNPLGNYIKPGDKVVLKPNLVLNNPRFQECLTTHPSIVRCVLDYVQIALKGKGEIIVGDAPLQSCDFDSLVKSTRLIDVINMYHPSDIRVKLTDFRKEYLVKKHFKNHRIIKRMGDPKGYMIIDLGRDSALDEISFNDEFMKFRVTNYFPQELLKSHNYQHHKYVISGSIIDADVIINLPKVKSHMKAGFTACLKNLIGINGNKDWLPHHRTGSRHEGGDEYLNKNLLKRIMIKLYELDDLFLIQNHRIHSLITYPINASIQFLKIISRILNNDPYNSGSWYGNDTLWRTIADLNRILLFADKNGQMKPNLQRNVINICDGIIIGEAEGPLRPRPKAAGILVAGENSLMTDLAIAELFHFDYKKIPQIFKVSKIKKWALTSSKPNQLKIISNNKYWNTTGLNQIEKTLHMEPSKHWKGHIEKNN